MIGSFQSLPGQLLSEQDRIRLEDPAAIAVRRQALGYIGSQIFPAAFQAVNFSETSVDFGHTAAAGAFMQSVYVLGDDVPQDAGLFKVHQGKVGGIGLILIVVADKFAPDCPVLRRILPENLGRSIHHGVVFFPKPPF